MSEQILSSNGIPFYINGKRVFIVFQGTNYDTEYDGGYIQASREPRDNNNRFMHYWKRITEVKKDDIIFHLASGSIKAVSIAQGIYKTADDNPEKNRVYCDYNTLENPIDYKALRNEIKKACEGFNGNCPFNRNGEGNQGYLYDSNKDLAVLFSKKILELNKNLSDKLEFLDQIKSLDEKSSDQFDDTQKNNRQTLIQKYSDTLLKSKNIILHGAPGTGKSFLAKQIAADIVSNHNTIDYESLSDEQKKRIGFVQFHPSYDYTDFVEGLRPKINSDGSMGFELQDGLFKKFIKVARNDYNNPATISNNKKEFSLKKGNKFFINRIDVDNIYIIAPENKKTTDEVTINKESLQKMLDSDQEFKRVKDVANYLGRKYIIRDDSYYLAFYNYIKEGCCTKEILEKETNEIKEKKEINKFVFIIDEINRGEISKIFGELFYSIDPGYRGKTGEISTQYSNLHENPEEKFYVPDNVYIIGTMNDIDRSVDSFDFAMRRRFRFIELKADEMTGMLDSLETMREDAEARMKRLNEAIIKFKGEGLNENYQIGAAYFLKLNEINVDQLWSDYLEPLLKDYIQGMPNEEEKLKSFKDAYYGNIMPNEVNADANSEG